MRGVVVDACWRGEPGTGSPTAVVEGGAFEGGAFDDAARARVAADAGVSHAVFVAREAGGLVRLRFFTAAGELPACGHGTLAALTALESWDDRDHWRLVTAGREPFTGGTTPAEGPFFDAGRPIHRVPSAAEVGPVLAALGAVPAGTVHAAGTARERLLVPVDEVGPLAPDAGALAAACDAAGLLGCFAYAPVRERSFAARMFAPSIGVSEDAANANSVAALAGVVAAARPPGPGGSVRLSVAMGDGLGSPSRIRAEAFAAAGGGVRVFLSGRSGPPRPL
ncbi:PhzF family phenazine biosynthesis protein [Glycomyces terrestris]|uniref:PhzF family phenazine biosynthesis protein n=1 Tax=Glycomyces terrestris TaxID=2493553 RepID=A0A426UVL3_9ACTN|nr:PhzF family phenazine biosynthesis protein [Glycomyces terrestris]RRR98362.1 PhzF family phenazine biosynthesis protein [Glycomyces terrestris]